MPTMRYVNAQISATGATDLGFSQSAQLLLAQLFGKGQVEC